MRHTKSLIGLTKNVLMYVILLLTTAHFSLAETFTIQIKEGNTGVSGVSIFGNQGVKDLPGRFTNGSGQWTVDTIDLNSSSFSLGFSHSSRGLRFEPAEISPSIATCPGRVCNVAAFDDGKPTAIIDWSVRTSQNEGIAGLPVTIPGALVPCAKVTDADGYVFFAVEKNLSACNDSDSNTSNNFYKLGHLQTSGKICSFATTLPNKFNTCTNSGNFTGFSTANCSAVSNLSVGSSVNYEVRVTSDNGSSVSGIKFYGITDLESSQTDSSGKLAFTTTQIGLNPNASFSLIPYGNDFQFIPSKIDFSPNSCANNICRVTAFKNGSPQGVVKWTVRNSGQGASGVNISVEDNYVCPNTAPAVSNQAGTAYFPSIVRTSCNIADDNRFNDLMSFNASQSGCTFTHNSQQAFQICPTQSIFDAEMSMYCNGESPVQFVISGKLYSVDGFPIPNAQVLSNGLAAATSDANGFYSITVDKNTYAKVEPQVSNTLFDPALVGIDKIASDFLNTNFYAVPAGMGGSDPSNPVDQCPVKSNYTVSGFVVNQDNSPVEGAKVYNDYVELATTNASGFYSFTVPAGESMWVTAEYYDDENPDGVYFDPAAYAYIHNFCDRSNVTFKKINVPSHYATGTVRDSTGEYPIANADVTIIYGGVSKTFKTSADGTYLHTVPDGEEFTIFASLDGHEFTPVDYQHFADRSYFSLDFNSNISLAPTPTATPTASNTPTLTATFTASVTRTATQTYTASSTATITRTPTITFTPSSTSTGTITASPTSTLTATPTPTSTETPTETYTASPTLTATQTFTPTMTGTFTKTATITRTATVTRTATKTGTPTFTSTATASSTPTTQETPTPLHTETAVATVTRTGTATRTSSPTATSTSTATATKTFTPSLTASPTNTPNLKPFLTSMCSVNASLELRWKVTNPTQNVISATWDIYGSNIRGTILLPAMSDVYFLSTRVSGENTARLFVDGQQVSVKSASYLNCGQATPTPNPTATWTQTPQDNGKKVVICHIPAGNSENKHTMEVNENALDAHLGHGDYLGACTDDLPAPNPTAIYTQTSAPGNKVLICHIPPGNPENKHTLEVSQNAVDAHLAHGDYLGACTDGTPAPVPTTRNTATATPFAAVSLSGSLKGKNGRNLTNTEKLRMQGSNPVIMITRTDAPKTQYTIPLSKNFDFKADLPKGQYSIGLDSGGRLTVTSVPKRYKLSLDKKTNVLFAVRLSNNALAKASAKK